MIGKGLRDLAKKYGMKADHGIAYGSMEGYCATLSEGSGYKQIIFTTRVEDATKRFALTELLQNPQLGKDYRINDFEVREDRVTIVFTDTFGTMKRIEAFLEWFLPQFAQFGATKTDICSCCGMMLDKGSWKLVNGVAICAHESCAQKLRDALTDEYDRNSAGGSYLTGAAGAFLGAILGSVAWAILMMIGYVASIVGFLIGFLAEKGYTLLKGKNGKGKLAILIIAVIIGVLLGYFVGYTVDLMKEFDMAFGEASDFVINAIQEDEKVRSAVLKDVLLGLLFAGLGVFAILRNTQKEVASPKFIDLE